MSSSSGRSEKLIDWLKRLTIAESVSSNASEGWKAGELHTRETPTLSESKAVNIADALKQRQVRKPDTGKRLASNESRRSDTSEGWKAREVHTGEIHTLCQKRVSPMLSSSGKSARQTATKRRGFVESRSPDASQGWEGRQQDIIQHVWELLSCRSFKAQHGAR